MRRLTFLIAVCAMAGVSRLHAESYYIPPTTSPYDLGCPAEYSYQQCVDAGYFNQYGNGVSGGGGPGGYCQNVKKVAVTTYVMCSDGHQYPCPNNYCANEPNSGNWCDFPMSGSCCPDNQGSIGQDVEVKACAK